MFLFKTRREREKIVVLEMIRMYCAGNHQGKAILCDECMGLAFYSEKRLLSCMYGDIKPVCKVCPVHCYSPQRREEMRNVMKYSGPRMIYRKPVYAIVHIIDKLVTPDSHILTKKVKHG